MPNFPGRRVYPAQTNISPARDFGQITKVEPTGIARGGTAEDYNIKLRGLGLRVDRKP